MPLTIDKLYEAFMDIDPEGDPLETKTPFAEDVYDWFGADITGKGRGEWASQYGMYLPTFDPAQLHLAERERDLDYRSAMDTLKTTQAATERVYATEMDTLSTSLGKELGKGREMAGRTGLRSGDLEGAIQDTIATTGSKAKDFGDRVRISEEEIDNKYNNAMVDSALDYDKKVRQEKEEFYDRTMAAIMRLMDKEAFDEGDACEGDSDCGGCQECNTSDGKFNYCFDPVGCVGGLVDNDLDGIGDSLIPGGGDDDGFETNICDTSPECCTDGVKDCDLCPEACPDLIDPNNPCPGGCGHLDCNEGFSPMCGLYGCYCMGTAF